ncbi:hypothetical protein E1176_00730, partial [Fulvivirga sp. RKSG066]|nr:hypothetical protein [Fulvivirga aurantia]
MGGELAGMDIWISEKDNEGKWGKPHNDLGVWNNRENNSLIGIKKDNNVVYLINGYSKGKGISFSKQLGGQWIKPELLPIKWVEREEMVGYYMHPDFDVMLLTLNDKNSIGKEDIYVSLKDSTGTWRKPINLGPTINTAGFEISPFLSADKKRLYFSSSGHDGLGDADIFMSERIYENDYTVWSTPVNLGEKINSSSFDAYFSTHDSIIYFSSNRNGGLSDIFTGKMKSVGKSETEQYAEQLIQEAKQLLKELRGESETKELFIEFSTESTDIESEQKKKLNDLVKFLNYQSYNELALLSVAYEPKSKTLHTERLSK